MMIYQLLLKMQGNGNCILLFFCIPDWEQVMPQCSPMVILIFLKRWSQL